MTKLRKKHRYTRETPEIYGKVQLLAQDEKGVWVPIPYEELRYKHEPSLTNSEAKMWERVEQTRDRKEDRLLRLHRYPEWKQRHNLIKERRAVWQEAREVKQGKRLNRLLTARERELLGLHLDKDNNPVDLHVAETFTFQTYNKDMDQYDGLEEACIAHWR